VSGSLPPDRPQRRAKHLIDPTAPRVRPSVEDLQRLERVQRWVMSVLVVTTIAHLSAGLVIFAVALDRDQETARIGLSVIAGAALVAGLSAGFAIHRRSPFSPWVLLGLLPTVVGLLFVL